jgi:hypothetical protein
METRILCVGGVVAVSFGATWIVMGIVENLLKVSGFGLGLTGMGVKMISAARAPLSGYGNNVTVIRHVTACGMGGA